MALSYRSRAMASPWPGHRVVEFLSRGPAKWIELAIACARAEDDWSTGPDHGEASREWLLERRAST
jgi:hypothetical protein